MARKIDPESVSSKVADLTLSESKHIFLLALL